LAMALGISLGFRCGERGMGWMPAMLVIILLACSASLVLVICGWVLERKLSRPTSAERGVSRRISFNIAMIIAGLLGRLARSLSHKSSPLTGLSPAEFDRAVSIALQRYYECAGAMESQLAALDQRKGMFESDTQRVLAADEEKFLRQAWADIYNCAFVLDQVRTFYEDWYRFGSSREGRKRHIRSFLLAFASELALYEKSSRLIRLVASNPNAVAFLDAPDPGGMPGENSFSRFREQLQGVHDRTRIVAGRQYLRWLETAFDGREDAKNLGCERLWNTVVDGLKKADAIGMAEQAAVTAGSELEVLKRAVNRAWFPAQSGVARWMGDVRLRRIGNYLVTPEQTKEMARLLEPGDILLVRKNWYLSNIGLPGFWPHAVLHVGSPAEFEKYFDDPEVLGWLRGLAGEDVTLGQHMKKLCPDRWRRCSTGDFDVIEAVSEGVILNSLEHACGDYVAALRPRLSKEAKAQAIIEAFGHLDKPYDFDFDFATDNALVCTELVWRSYRPAEGKQGLDLKLVEIAGRMTLPANEIARIYAEEFGSANRQMDFVYFIDAREETKESFIATEESFRESHKRTKWDFAVE
jgi:hypothetical protein